MIKDFTDQRPVLSAVVVVLLFTIVPGSFVLISDIVSGGKFNSLLVIFMYALLVELAMWLFVERFVLIVLPFIVMLSGFIVSEIVYTVSLSMSSPGAGPSGAAYSFSSVMVKVFGAEASGIVAAIICYVAFCIVKGIWNLIKQR